jgi:hypothetical protein
VPHLSGDIPASLKAALDEETARTGRSTSAVVTAAVASFRLLVPRKKQIVKADTKRLPGAAVLDPRDEVIHGVLDLICATCPMP